MAMIEFPTEIETIQQRVQEIDPIKYGSSRNYKSGAVTYLSPYISRGVISTKLVYEYLLTLGLEWKQIEKLTQELAWRDYWQQVWISKGNAIKTDIKFLQEPVVHAEIPLAVIKGQTGIETVDESIQELIKTGYMHNHMRMYVASICCNIAKAHWFNPAMWMYSNLLDGDPASNLLSWQWVAGANANKKYFANQENINRFFESSQKGTFLDVSYEAFPDLPIPDILKEYGSLDISTKLPQSSEDKIEQRKTLVYNYFNLDPNWYKEENLQRVLLLEPSFFKEWPVSEKCIDFTIALSENVQGIKIFNGSFDDLQKQVGKAEIVFKEHPTNSTYKGTEVPRQWMTEVKGYFPSFFKFWKQGKKELEY